MMVISVLIHSDTQFKDFLTPLWVWKSLFGHICHKLNVTWLAFVKYAPSSDFLAPGRSFYLNNMIRLISGGKDSKIKSKIPAKLLDPHPHGWNDLTKVDEQEMQLDPQTLGSARSTDTDTLSSYMMPRGNSMAYPCKSLFWYCWLIWKASVV